MYSVEDTPTLAVLAMRYPKALIIPLPSGRWAGHTCAGLVQVDSLEQLGEQLNEIYGEPCQVIPLHSPNGG